MWQEIRDAAELGQRGPLAYVGRLSRSGRRLFRFGCDAGEYYAVWCDEIRAPVTLLSAGMVAGRRDGRGPLLLRGDL